MDRLREVLVLPDMQIHDVIERIDRSSQQIAIVTDEKGHLLGTVTDGDIRRGILKGVSMNSPVSLIMNPRPIKIPKLTDRQSVLTILQMNKLRHLPVVDDEGRVVGVERLDELLVGAHEGSWVVIMAGGAGRRLGALTRECPKPMLKIGGKPVLETILEQLILQGFRRFCVSVHYRAEQIMGYFGDGGAWGAEIRYIGEPKQMGTAGSLSLLPFRTTEPILVVNGDILTRLSFGQLLDFHLEHQAKATLAVTTYDYQVPYGVIKSSRDRLIGFEEKPVYTSFINAGIYALSPEALRYVPPDSYFDMDSLFEAMLRNDEPLCIFPIREYWADIGTADDFQRAERDFASEFSSGK